MVTTIKTALQNAMRQSIDILQSVAFSFIRIAKKICVGDYSVLCNQKFLDLTSLHDRYLTAQQLVAHPSKFWFLQ